MNSKVIEGIDKLRDDRSHGASWLSQQAIHTLSLAASESQAYSIPDFVEEIRSVALELAKVRDSITPIANYTNQFLTQVIDRSRTEKDLASLKKFAAATGKELIKSSLKAVSKAVEYGCGIVTDLDTVATCSYSSTVCQVFERSRERGAKFRVIVAESTFDDKAYGKITAQQLMKHQIPVEIIPDADIRERIGKADKALIGADSVTKDGFLITGAPALVLAQEASRKRIPVYAVCETAKFDIYGYLDKSLTLEPGFEKIPPDLITGIITEKGTMQPGLVVAYIEQTRQRAS